MCVSLCVYRIPTHNGLQELIQVLVLNLHSSSGSMTQQTFNNCTFFKVLEGNDASL